MPDPETRIISREDGDRRDVVLMPRTPETDQLTDEQILAKLDKWKRSRQPHPVTDEHTGAGD